MNGTDQKKVTAAGFTIIRKDDTPSPRIKYKAKDIHEWQTLEKDFPSKAARDRRANDLLKISTIIED